MKSLKNKVAIVTGASSGIGRATARLFALEGARVVVSARRAAELDALVNDIEREGGHARALAGNICEESMAQRLVDMAVSEFGGLDIAVNNAGTLGASRKVSDIGMDEWREVMDTNLTSAFLGAKHQVPAMIERGGGSLIFTSSFVGHSAGMPQMAAYAASKAGQIGLVKALATEWGSQGIRVNAVLPGGTDTPASITNAPGATPQVLAFVEGLHALKRMATPQEIAQAILFLASSASSFVTGTAFLVDGGVSINRT